MKNYTIAKKAGISAAFLSEIMHGKKRPSWSTANRLADLTGTDVKIWMDGDLKKIRTAIHVMKLDPRF